MNKSTDGSLSMLASDNATGVHPLVLEALAEANQGHSLGYGNDPWTARMDECFRETFGGHVEIFAVTTGTAANVLALKGMLASHQSILCSDVAHLLVDECGAPENVTGSKLVGISSTDGRLDLAAVEAHLQKTSGIVHHSQPGVVSLAQVTERGTLYRAEEIAAIVDLSRRYGLRVHMDGARLANAAVALGLTLRELTTELGIDVLSFGGTKNGLMMAEAIVVLNPALANSYGFIRKQGMQLISKQRFLAAQFLAYFDNQLWQRNAEHANRMAALLAEGLQQYSSVQLDSPVEANMIFATLPEDWVEPLQQVSYFNLWNAATSEVRLITGFDTRHEDIERFLAAVADLEQRTV